MKKLLLPIMTLAMIMLPAGAHAAQCRDTETGKFAKCGAPGSVPASQYVAKTKTATKAKSKAMAMPMAAPAAAPAKPGFMAMMKARMAEKAAAKPTAMPTKGAMTMPMAKAVRCKNAKSKFVKCGTPGAKPV